MGGYAEVVILSSFQSADLILCVWEQGVRLFPWPLMVVMYNLKLPPISYLDVKEEKSRYQSSGAAFLLWPGWGVVRKRNKISLHYTPGPTPRLISLSHS